MAIVVTNLGQNASKGTTTNQSVTIPAGGVPAGSLIVVCFQAGAVSGAINVSVTDTANNTYLQPASLQTTFLGNASNDIQIAYAFNCAALVSGNTITVTNNSATLSDMSTSFFFATGVQTTSDPLDAHGTATGTSGTPSVSTTASTSQTGELIVGMLMVAGPSGDTFTQDGTNEGGFATPPVRVGTTGGGASANRTIAGGNVPGWTGSGVATYAPTITSRQWSSVIGTFKAAAVPEALGESRIFRVRNRTAY